MVITSVDNQKIKTIRALKEKKYRDELGKYYIEGYRVVKDSLDYLSEPELIFSESSFNKYADEFPGGRISLLRTAYLQNYAIPKTIRHDLRCKYKESHSGL